MDIETREQEKIALRCLQHTKTTIMVLILIEKQSKIKNSFSIFPTRTEIAG